MLPDMKLPSAAVNSLVPMVLKQGSDGYERSFDIFSLLLNQRIIFLNGQVEDGMASIIVASLLYLASEDPSRDIQMWINSPGGSVISGLSIYDCMQYVKPDVVTICTGMAASMGMFLLNAGAPGKRHALPSARVMGHQVSAGQEGHILDIKTQFLETERLNDYLMEKISLHSGNPLEKVLKDLERDYWMSAQQAKDWGCIDSVILPESMQQPLKTDTERGGSVRH